jgi:F420-non-reducing hydrogenase iron-sulfur subunit
MDERFTPNIVGFLCNWCSYTGADLAGTSRLEYPPSLKVIRVMCSGRVDPVFILKAFLMGADGVLVGGCHPGDCHYQTNNYYARRRIALLKKVFETLGLESDRVRLSWISASEGERFKRVNTEFTEKLEGKGPNPTKAEVFL